MTTAPVPPTKADLRQDMRARLRALPPDAAITAGNAITSLACQHPLVIAAGALAAYAATGGEPDLAPLVDWALAAGKAVYYPRYVAASGQYELARITSRAALRPGHFGLAEPLPAAPALALAPAAAPLLWLVPGLAFDRQGGRLGRGQGFYDRLLAGSTGARVGIAHHWQVVPCVPRVSHDLPMTHLFTDAGAWSCQPLAS